MSLSEQGSIHRIAHVSIQGSFLSHLDRKGLAAENESARRKGAWIVFQDESGFSLLPSVRATFTPRGETPILHHHFSWTRLSMSAALAFRPDGTEAALVFQIKDGTYATDSLIEFLIEFHRLFATERIVLIWDGLPSHKSKAMTEWIREQRDWLSVERLPAYSPDLNPVELVWGNVKSNELANPFPEAIDDAEVAATAGLSRVGESEQLCFNFLAHSGLSL